MSEFIKIDRDRILLSQICLPKKGFKKNLNRFWRQNCRTTYFYTVFHINWGRNEGGQP